MSFILNYNKEFQILLIKELKKNRPKSMRMTFNPGTIIDRKDLPTGVEIGKIKKD